MTRALGMKIVIVAMVKPLRFILRSIMLDNDIDVATTLFLLSIFTMKLKINTLTTFIWIVMCILSHIKSLTLTN